MKYKLSASIGGYYDPPFYFNAEDDSEATRKAASLVLLFAMASEKFRRGEITLMDDSGNIIQRMESKEGGVNA